MASTLKTSLQGLEIVDRARRHKGWNKTEVAWQVRADVSKSTLDRFWMQKPIKHQNFVAICEAVGVDWEQIVDLPAIEPTNITRKSNLAQVNQPVTVELEELGQQIFDWFGALDFTAEGLPRREGKYVEWIIRVPARRKFDRVLIRATIHEVGLSDLDSLRRGVAQLRVDEGWLVTNLWVSQSVRQAVNKSDDENLTCLTFDELIDQDANFTPYLEWLEREIKKREIDRYYVDLGCTKGEFDADTRTLRGTSKYSVADGGIDRYIDRWLENPVTEHVSILGEFGTGKTWFALHYAGKCLQAYQAAKSKGMPRPRLPLVIPLRDYAKALNVENVLAGFFYTQHNIRLNSDVFDRLNRMGKLLLIFDGFDEMADKIDTQKMTDNFWELAKVVTPNAKVILTCRTEHFPTAQDERENLSGERQSSTANKIAVAPKFETLELMKFDDVQIREVLARRTNLATVELVMANSQLLDLLRRAVMAEFVLEALPEIEAGKPIDLARVYLYAVRHKMERDITTGRTFTSLADKLYFLCELAWEMLSEDKMTLNYREFPDRLRVLFKDEVKEQKHLDHWHYDMMGQTMLIRNDDGDYSPAHRSLLEFFVAYKLAAELGLLADDFLEMARNQSGIDEGLTPEFYTWSSYWRREVEHQDDNNCVRKLIAPLTRFMPESSDNLHDTFGKSPLTKAILDLLLPALNLEVKYQESNLLLDLIKSTKASDIGYLGGNAATVLVKLNSDALEYQDLNNTNLAHANLVNAGLRGTDLSGATLENCYMTMVFGSANAIIMSNDDRQFITAHNDKTIRVWDRASGRELQRLTGHQGAVYCITLGIDGLRLYSGSQDGSIKQWQIADGICEHTFDVHQDSVRSIILSADGKLLYSGSDNGTIKQLHVATGICDYTGACNQSPVMAIALSADGKLLYSGSRSGTIKQWRVSDGNCENTFTGHQNGIMAIALSADSELLYSGSDDGTIKQWRVSDGSCKNTFTGHQNGIMAIALSADSKLLYSGSRDGTIKQWQVVDGRCENTFTGHQSWVITIALSADGTLLYSCSEDGTINQWDIAVGRCERTFEGYKDWVGGIDLSADGKWLYSGGNDGKIREWNLSNGICQRTFDGHQGWIKTIVVSTDGKLYSGGYDGKIREWNLSNGICQRTFDGHQGWLMAIVLSVDGQYLYAGSNDRTIKKWNLFDGTCQSTLEQQQDWMMILDMSRDEKFRYSISNGRTIVELNLIDKTCRLFEGHKSLIRSIKLSMDEQFLYSCGEDNTIKEWNLADGTCHYSFEEHQDSVTAIALSIDDKFLYSCSNDLTIKKWNLKTRKCLHTIDHRLCAGANITNVKGLTPAQIDSLFALGAIDENRK
jgi:WD40 repeat protein